MAAPSFVAVGSQASGTTGSVSYPLPAGITDGDTLIAGIESSATTGVTTSTSGWADVAGSPRAQGSNTLAVNALIDTYTSGDGNLIGAASNNHQTGAIAAFRGAGGVDATSNNSGNGGVITGLGVTTTVDECRVVLVAAWGADTATPQFTNVSNASLTDVTVHYQAGTSNGNGGGILIASGVKATAGPVNAWTADLGTTQTWAMLVIALAPAPTTTPVIAYGDSYTAADTQNTPGMRAITQLASRLSLSVTNHAQSGDMIGDGAEKSIGGTSGRAYAPGSTPLVISYLGTNDLKSTDDAQKRASLLHYLRAHYTVLSAAERIEESTATKTGTWGTNTGAWFPSGGENASTTADGSTATFTVTTPGKHTLLLFGTRGSTVGGIFTVTQGGTTLATIDTDETVSLVERNSNAVGPLALPLGNVAAGSVVVTFSTAGRTGATGFLDALVRIDETAPPTVLAVKPVTVTYAPYFKPDLLTAIRSAIDTVAAEFPNVRVCDPLPGWDTATMLGADGLHPNDAGMTHIADAMEATLTGPSQSSGAGTWTFAGTGAGARASQSVGSNVFTFTGSGSGSTSRRSSGAGVFAFTGSGSGVTARQSGGSGSWAFIGAGTGVAPSVTARSGSGSGAWAFVGSGSGRRSSRSSGVGTLAFVGNGSGSTPAVGAREGSGSGAWTFTGTGTGKTPRRSSAAGVFQFVGSGAGSTTRSASGTGTTAWTGVGAGWTYAEPTEFQGRILAATIGTPTASGELSTPTATGAISIPRATGVIT